LKGTVLYFAPEVIKKKGYDRGVDLWALGVLTYELMFQEAPFSFSTVKSKNF
jgi:serine/threonine protein kinase